MAPKTFILNIDIDCVGLKLLSPAKAKEKALKALFARKLMGRGWLSALLGYLAKREELKVRLKYIGDVTLQRTDFEALAANAYYTAKCWPGPLAASLSYRTPFPG